MVKTRKIREKFCLSKSGSRESLIISKIDYNFRVIIIFSMSLSMRVTILPNDPRPLVILRRLFKSSLFNVRVNSTETMKIAAKKTKPMPRRIGLEKLSAVTSTYVGAPAASDEIRIFADERQSIVNP